MQGISSKAAGSLENKRGFNGNEIQHSEFSDGSGLEIMDFNARMYDQQTGRFGQVDMMADENENASPYVFANNNPITQNDPTGLTAGFANDSLGRAAVLPDVVVTGHKSNSNTSSSGGMGMGLLGTLGDAPAIPLGGYGTGAGMGISTEAVAAATGYGVIIVAAVWAQVKLSELDRKLRENRWYIVYKKVNPITGAVYIGRCSGFGETAEDVLKRYDAGHRMDALDFGEAKILDRLNGSITEKITPPYGNTFHIAEISGYAATRGREQQEYAAYKNAGYTMGNSINPVWQLNPLAPTYYAASVIAFGPLVPYTDQWLK